MQQPMEKTEMIQGEKAHRKLQIENFEFAIFNSARCLLGVPGFVISEDDPCNPHFYVTSCSTEGYAPSPMQPVGIFPSSPRVML